MPGDQMNFIHIVDNLEFNPGEDPEYYGAQSDGIAGTMRSLDKEFQKRIYKLQRRQELGYSNDTGFDTTDL